MATTMLELAWLHHAVVVCEGVERMNDVTLCKCDRMRDHPSGGRYLNHGACIVHTMEAITLFAFAKPNLRMLQMPSQLQLTCSCKPYPSM